MDFSKPIRCLLRDIDTVNDGTIVLIAGQVLKVDAHDNYVAYLLTDNTG